MPAGLQVINDAYTLTIDENFKNLSAPNGQGFSNPIGFPYTNYDTGCRIKRVIVGGATRPDVVIALRCTGSTAATIASIDNTASPAGFFYADVAVWGTGDVSMYIAAPVNDSNVALHGVGIQVFNASGSIVFDSNFRPVRVVGITGLTNAALADVSGNTLNPTVINTGIPGTYAAFVTQPRWATRPNHQGAQPTTITYTEAVTVNSTGAATSCQKYVELAEPSLSSGIYSNSDYGGQIVLIDVSGINVNPI